MNPLFPDQGIPADQPLDETKDYAADLIGEGKKYKDVQVAARSIVEKDSFIERLKAENAVMRSSLKGEQKMDEFLDKLSSYKPAPPGSVTNPVTTPDESSQSQQLNITPKALSLEEVQALLDKREEEKKKQANLDAAAAGVQRAFGANSGVVLLQKATELGVTKEYLTRLAAESPQAFLKLVEADKAPSGAPGFIPSSTNTAAFKSGSNEKNQAYYDNLKKQMGITKFTADKTLQNEMHSQAQKMGRAFFS